MLGTLVGDSVGAEVAKTRETHVGLNIGQSVAEHTGIAVPIINGNAPVTTTLAVAGPW